MLAILQLIGLSWLIYHIAAVPGTSNSIASLKLHTEVPQTSTKPNVDASQISLADLLVTISYQYRCRNGPFQVQRFQIIVTTFSNELFFKSGSNVDFLYNSVQTNRHPVSGHVSFSRTFCPPAQNGIQCTYEFKGSMSFELRAQYHVEAYWHQQDQNITPATVIQSCALVGTAPRKHCPTQDPGAEHCDITGVEIGGTS